MFLIMSIVLQGAEQSSSSPGDVQPTGVNGQGVEASLQTAVPSKLFSPEADTAPVAAFHHLGHLIVWGPSHGLFMQRQIVCQKYSLLHPDLPGRVM